MAISYFLLEINRFCYHHIRSDACPDTRENATVSFSSKMCVFWPSGKKNKQCTVLHEIRNRRQDTSFWYYMTISDIQLVQSRRFSIIYQHPLRPFLLFFLLTSWRALQSYRPYLKCRDPSWGNDWSHNPSIRRSPSRGLPGFSSAVWKMPGDLCTAPGILSLAYMWLTQHSKQSLWQRTRTGAGGTATLA